jgi:RTX calcium-binding nonapeptide repeat (4 copies)
MESPTSLLAATALLARPEHRPDLPSPPPPNRGGSRMTRRIALAGSLAAALLGIGADQAAASYTSRIQDDTLTLTGNSASDKLAVQSASPTELVVDVGEDGTIDFTFDRAQFSAVVVNAGGGDDEVRLLNAVDPEPVTVNGGSGADRLLGDNGANVLNGEGGNDFVDGNIGADAIDLGTGNDVNQWDPGDGSDRVEGEGGTDVLDFNGSNAGEIIEVSANGARGLLTRNIASITQDFDGIEGLDIATLGSTDNVTVNDVGGTAVKTVDVNLAGFDGTGDAAADSVTVNGTDGSDSVVLRRVDTQVQVRGLAAQTRVVGGEPALDTLRIQTLGGDDRVTLEDMVNGLINPIVDLGLDD